MPSAFDEGFQTGVMICAVACAAGGVLALATIRPEDTGACEVEPLHLLPLTGPSAHVGEAAGAASRP